MKIELLIIFNALLMSILFWLYSKYRFLRFIADNWRKECLDLAAELGRLKAKCNLKHWKSGN